MFKRLTTVYKKVHSFLFGQENEHIHTREDRKQYYGRIKTDYEAEARIIHQYPKQGKFRFPLIEDEKNRQMAKKRNEQQVPQTIKVKNLSEQKKKSIKREEHQVNVEKVLPIQKDERKKFQGVNFRAANIPSPIYAFTKPPTSNKPFNDSWKNDQYEENNLVENVYEEKLMENNMIDDCIVEEQLINEENSKVETDMSQKEVAATTVFEQVIEELDTIDEGLAVNQSHYLEPIAVLEKEETTKHDLLGEGEEVKEAWLADCHKPDCVANEQPLEQIDQSTHKLESEPDPREHQRRTVVPFNVLMLHKDRTSQKKQRDDKEKSYQFPTVQLLNIPDKKVENSDRWLGEKKKLLEDTLANFNVQAKVVGVTKGPSVTRFEIQPEAGVKVSKVTSLIDDIKLSLAAKDIRIEAPIPGRNAIGIEVPNDVSEPVVIREILRSGEFQNSSSPLAVAMGLDIAGKPVVTDIQKMPHGLIAGATGSGKSVCINSILISIMFKATPDEVKLMLIDPKMVELAPYNDIPHLVTPVITDAKQATIALKWAVEEMERRYELFVQNSVRDIKRYNEVMKKDGDKAPAMPYIVIIIDELADLMMVSPQDVEEAICRIAQKARACGIHLLVATQRPSVDVITGLIKANIPTRIAFSVSSQADSRTIIDSGGAERLLGKGDMLLFENGSSKPVRVQGNFVSDEEIDRVIALVKKERQPNYLFDKEHLVKTYEATDQEDDLFEEACYYVLEQGGASSSSLQRRFRIGFNRAARLIDMMEARGIISEAMGSKPRNILVSEEELVDIL